MRSQRRWILSGVLLFMLTGLVIVRLVRTQGGTGVITVGQQPMAIAVDGPKRHAFITNSLDNTVSMVDTEGGAVLRTIAVGRAPSAVVVDVRTSRAFVLNHNDSTVSILDSASGDVLGTVYVPNSAALAVDELAGHVFIVRNSNATFTSPGSLMMLDSLTGRILHRARLGGAAGWVLKGVALDPHTRRGWLTNCMDGTVSIFDTISGRIVGTRTLGGCPVAVRVDRGAGRVFVSNQTDGTVRMLDAGTGAVLHTTGVSQIPIALAVSERTERVFVLDNDLSANNATVSMLDARTGRLQRAVDLAERQSGAPCVLLSDIAVDGQHGRTFVIVNRNAEPGNVRVFDARTGRVKRTIALGGAPVAMAVDETTGHLFIVNQAQGTVLSSRSRLSGQDGWGWAPSWLQGWMPWLNQPPRPRTSGNVAMFELAHL
jgi:YVTN family beta-propeller protein